MSTIFHVRMCANNNTFNLRSVVKVLECCMTIHFNITYLCKMITLLGKNPRGGGTKDGYIKDGPVWKHINSVRLHSHCTNAITASKK